MTTTPYDIIGKEALYDMIDYFYTLVEKMNDLITCFQEILQKQVVNKNNF